MKAPLPLDELNFPGKSYDIGWDGKRTSTPDIDALHLPQADYAIYLINTVKFHVGQLFFLFDEDDFMANFRRFYDTVGATSPTTAPLWYNHFLIILAFGKAFVAREISNRRPPGCEYFVHAMATLPDLHVYDAEPLEAIEILCSAALYFHSLDFRGSAYRLVGDALRLSLDAGLHTDMQNGHIPDDLLQRARRCWWTVHLLDRQLSSLQGLPLAMPDQSISAGLPSFSNSAQKVLVLNVHIKLSRVLAMIVNNIYGKEGRLNATFLVHTKAALKAIADVTDELNGSVLQLHLDRSYLGMSRVSAYLHLLQHECILMATRPVLFNCLEARLAHEDQPATGIRPPENIWALLQLCKNSACHSLLILRTLQKEGLLEAFLPFDLDAIYVASLPPFMDPHCQRSFHRNDIKGNMVAKQLASELKKLEIILSHLPPRQQEQGSASEVQPQPQTTIQGQTTAVPGPTPSMEGIEGPQMTVESMDWLNGCSGWPEHFGAVQMTSLAENIDLDGMDWWFNSSAALWNWD